MATNKEELSPGLVLNIEGIEGYSMVIEVNPTHNKVKLLNLTTEQELEREYDSVNMALTMNVNTISRVKGEDVIGVINQYIGEKTTQLRELRNQVVETEKGINTLHHQKNLIRGYYEAVL